MRPVYPIETTLKDIGHFQYNKIINNKIIIMIQKYRRKREDDFDCMDLPGRSLENLRTDCGQLCTE